MKTLDGLLAEMLATEHASDLHLSVGEPPIFRIAGTLTRTDAPPLTAEAMEALLAPSLTTEERQRLESGVPIVKVHVHDPARPVSVTLFRERGGRLGAAFRRMPDVGFTLEAIAPVDTEILRKICQITRGLIVCSGPSGSGKATTAAGLLQEINQSRAERIFVIETYPGYVFQGDKSVITQFQVGRDVESVERGIQTAMHSDVDVLLLGDLPDEAIPAALAAAETGHLVIVVMEARSVRSAIESLLAASGDPQKLSNNLQVVLRQELMPRSDRSSGRVAAYEILIATPTIRNMVREGNLAGLESVVDSAQSIGMKSMAKALATLVDAGLITRDLAQTRLPAGASLPG